MQDHDKTKEQLIAELGELRLKMGEFESAVKTSNEQKSIYLEMIDKVNEAVYIVQDGWIKFANQACSELTGYSNEKGLATDAIGAFVHQDDREMVSQHHACRLQGDKAPYCYDFRIICQDGSIKWVEMKSALIMWEGRPAGLCIMTDITESKKYRDALLSTLGRFHAILSNLCGGLLLVTNDGDVEFANKAFCDLFDIGDIPKELHGLKAPELIEKVSKVFADPDKTFSRIMEIVAENRSIKGEEINLIDGRTYIRDFVPITVDGKPYGRFWHYTDISERKRAEKKLAEREKHLQLIAETIQEVFWIATPQRDTMIYISPAYEKIWGRTCQSLYDSPSSFVDTIHPEDRDQVVAILNEHRLTVTPWAATYRVVRPDGSIHWIKDQGFPVYDERGNRYLYAGVARDITERKQAEEELRQHKEHLEELVRMKTAELMKSEERFRRLAENAIDVIYRKSIPDGKYEYMSPAALNVFGYSPEEFYSDPSLIKKIIHPDWASDYEKKWEKALHGDLPDTYEYQIIHRSGQVKWLNQRNVLVLNEIGQPVAIECIVTDVSEQKRVETENHDLLAQLFESQKMEALSTLVCGIAHDFNNMLAAIIGYGQLLLDDKTKGEPGYEDLQNIIRQGQGGADLVKKLLAFSQEGQAIPVPLDLNRQIRDLAPIVSRTLPETIQVELDLADKPTMIRADHNQIYQVLVNLIINASEAMSRGGRLKIVTTTVSLDDEYCRRRRGAKPGEHVMVSVSDTGLGMDKKTLARIFDPFFSTKQRSSKRGTGLGLSVAKGIVEQLGGHITCESEPGKGTEFKVFLPAIDASLITAKTILGDR